MKNKIIIIGGGSSAIIVAENIQNAKDACGSQIEVLGLAYDKGNIGDDVLGYPIVSNVAEAYTRYKRFEDVKFIFQQYDMQNMKEAIEFKDSLEIANNKYCNFIHPSTMLSRSAQLGIGNVVLSHCAINPKAYIGNFNSIMTHVTIGHDAIVGDYNLVATQSVVSNLVMGSRNFIGMNTATNNKIRIGDDCMIGMCSNVQKDVESGSIVYGNPAKKVLTQKKLR